ncbi:MULTISPECIES: MaoC family dehydratase [unclassified Sulfitobacter]|uniref:MaoC family dehydratase n=2 Tax=Sulfitobacter TaxID=60136 RepID=UPI0009EEE8DA|nr:MULTISPECIES: MaoC family dehydratase [unclassified Sulfitobacter]
MTVMENFDKIELGEVVRGRSFTVTTETIQDFGDASLDYNPLHFDPDWMEKNDFGGTSFGSVIMHGMQNFALITRTLTDWLVPRGGYHRRLETRWIKPVKLGDTITPEATVSRKNLTDSGQWVQFDIVVKNQHGDPVATGQGLAEFRETIPV